MDHLKFICSLCCQELKELTRMRLAREATSEDDARYSSGDSLDVFRDQEKGQRFRISDQGGFGTRFESERSSSQALYQKAQHGSIGDLAPPRSLNPIQRAGNVLGTSSLELDSLADVQRQLAASEPQLVAPLTRRHSVLAPIPTSSLLSDDGFSVPPSKAPFPLERSGSQNNFFSSNGSRAIAPTMLTASQPFPSAPLHGNWSGKTSSRMDFTADSLSPALSSGLSSPPPNGSILLRNRSDTELPFEVAEACLTPLFGSPAAYSMSRKSSRDLSTCPPFDRPVDRLDAFNSSSDSKSSSDFSGRLSAMDGRVQEENGDDDEDEDDEEESIPVTPSTNELSSLDGPFPLDLLRHNMRVGVPPLERALSIGSGLGASAMTESRYLQF